MAHSLFIIAGESSGDLHGAHLAHALRERQPDVELAGMGGQAMAEAGVEVRGRRQPADLGPHLPRHGTLHGRAAARCRRAHRLPRVQPPLRQARPPAGDPVHLLHQPPALGVALLAGEVGSALRGPHARHPAVRDGVLRQARRRCDLRRAPAARCARRLSPRQDVRRAARPAGRPLRPRRAPRQPAEGDPLYAARHARCGGAAGPRARWHHGRHRPRAFVQPRAVRGLARDDEPRAPHVPGQDV